ncbi:MAG: hypothetical protein ACR2FO_09310 [Actinomycetota bacterium]
MEIKDSRDRVIDEITVRLTRKELTELFLAASDVEGGTADHVYLRDQHGSAMAIYLDAAGKKPLERASDWWVGPILLLALALLIIGAFTVARGFVSLLF